MRHHQHLPNKFSQMFFFSSSSRSSFMTSMKCEIKEKVNTCAAPGVYEDTPPRWLVPSKLLGHTEISPLLSAGANSSSQVTANQTKPVNMKWVPGEHDTPNTDGFQLSQFVVGVRSAHAIPARCRARYTENRLQRESIRGLD